MPLRALRRAVAGTVVMLGFGAPLRAQDVWVGPAAPCTLEPGHRLVREASERLKVAVETDVETQRESQLTDAYENLVRAVQGFRQEANPAAWYYLGRYFTIRRDPAGMDSTFRRALELAPDCAEDIARYRGELQTELLSRALQAWTDGNTDSAAAAFHLARSLAPDDANLAYYLARMYAGAAQLDSAERYISIGDGIGGDPANVARQRRAALLDVARAHESRGMSGTTTEQMATARIRRDSLFGGIERDSTMLAQLIAEWAGQPLRPEVRQRVQRDSTTLAQRLTAARQALPGITGAIARDSAAAWVGLGPALAAYERYTTAYPDDARTVFQTLRVAAIAGATGALERVIGLVHGLDEINLDELSLAAVVVLNHGHYGHAARLLDGALTHNPYHRTGLFLLTRAYYAVGDKARSMAAARRLLALDPLNPQTAQMMAGAWALEGHRDSAQHYVALSRGGMGWAVNVTQLIPTESASIVNGSVQNVSGRPMAAGSLVFEFLRADGSVLGASTVTIPALPTGGQHALQVRLEQGGAVAWRYRKQ